MPVLRSSLNVYVNAIARMVGSNEKNQADRLDWSYVIPNLNSAATPLVTSLAAVNRHSLALVGGKAANLGEMIGAGLPVPDGFCVTTAAYAQIAAAAGLDAVYGALEQTTDSAASAALAATARTTILAVALPTPIAAAIRAAYAALGGGAVAVRSSATAEDLPDASFAGQQDTYLNIIDDEALLLAVRRCWASLWTERAVAYRTANQIDQRAVQLAVVVQRLIPAAVAGVAFTANPLTNCHTETLIDAAPGLGEALVSGAVNPDHFVVDALTATITSRQIAQKMIAIHPAAGGGTTTTTLSSAAQAAPTLRDDQVLAVARLGGAVAAHYGAPQDIEWAVDAAGALWLLQARPITTLYPPPDGVAPTPPRAFFSVNMAQGVLQPFTPLGLDVFRQLARAAAELLGFPLADGQTPAVLGVAAERLFLDITPLLRRPWGRRLILTLLGKMEPRTADALLPLLSDPRFAATLPTRPRAALRRARRVLGRSGLPRHLAQALRDPGAARAAIERDVAALLAPSAAPAADGRAALARSRALLAQVPVGVLLRVAPAAMFGGVGAFFVAQRLARSFGAEATALLVSRGLPHNVTTEMSLALWAASQQIKADPAALAALLGGDDRRLAAAYHEHALPPLLQRVLGEFLARYGVRGVAEIDAGVPRWSDDPSYLVGVLRNYVQLDDPALAPDRQFRRAAAEAEAAVAELVVRSARSGPLGVVRAAALRWLLRRVRALMGLRETPKFYAVAAFARCRADLLKVGAELVAAGRLRERDDIVFLTLAEAEQALDGADLRGLVAARQVRYAREGRRQRLPRVLLGDGTILDGAPPSAGGPNLVGSAASPGTYTGRARVVLSPAGAQLAPGEILVAPSTDPGWTPLFLTAGALVMEMGGMMSHGAVVAREYGIPAVVGALGATAQISDGQLITVDGTRGLVFLSAARAPNSDA